ncbi:hypothetical protein CVT24_007958 [Panaeolus cyanescens]|uniref:Glucosidase 2 subunit beta n=1 Tax=Panaeolus cyanescens TaxID=181874 RepID=A0A409W4Z1_9AGAR|nr:hypothetical protein CVT24_007958 [Panaeolus cyanescens]
MIRWSIFLLSVTLAVAASRPQTLGVPPPLLSKYVPSKSNTWTCLDGSKEIPWNFVNDDSCDCPDGSDELGTAACPNTTFWCKNEGHIGAIIQGSRVNDGLCEPECCDGSDEQPGVCPNNCKEIGEAYRKKKDEENKIRKTGSKIRSTYIAFASKEIRRLQVEVMQLNDDIKVKEREVQRLEDVAERTEALSQQALDEKKESPLYQTLLSHRNALKSLQREHKKHLEREKALGQILDTLRTGYNPNYQDMAVLEAVRGWEELAGLPHINDVGKDDATKEEEAREEVAVEEPLEDGAWTAMQLEYQLDSLLNQNLETLLIQHEEHINAPSEPSSLFDIASYLPDSILPLYEDFKDSLTSSLEKLGIVKASGRSSADSSAARLALTNAQNELRTMEASISSKEESIRKIYDVTGFGAEGQWKKLDNLCLEKDTGDYTYEVCLFNEVKQKPNHGGQTFSLGRYESWNPSPDVSPGSPEYYSKQVYARGTRCWNGPERNTKVLLSCGIENAILTVQELEKCEYQITGTTPALCLPLEDSKKGSRDEL